MDVQALATDRTAGSSLSYAYRVTLASNALYLSPEKLTQLVLRDTGLIACESQGRCRDRLALPCSVVEHGWAVRKNNPNLSYSSGISCCVWTFRDEISRCIALALHSRAYAMSRPLPKDYMFVFVRKHECLPRSSQSVLRDSGKMIAERSGNKTSDPPNITVHII